MTEWGVVGVIIALVGLVVTVVGPMIKVNSALTKTSTILDRLNKLEQADSDFRINTSQIGSQNGSPK